MRNCTITKFFLSVSLLTLGCSTIPKVDFTPAQNVPLTGDSWSVLFSGQGHVGFGSDGLRLVPRTPKSADETFSALTIMKTATPFRNFRLRVRYEVLRQLRTEKPNPWETLWVLFNFRTESHREWKGKETNYVILKPNGVELGRAWGRADQKFLATRNEPRLEMGPLYTLLIEREGGGTRVTYDRNPPLHFSDSAWPDVTYDHPGTIGLYVEDAEVLVRSVEIDRSSVGEKDGP